MTAMAATSAGRAKDSQRRDAAAQAIHFTLQPS
jgi:hypothetical protein